MRKFSSIALRANSAYIRGDYRLTLLYNISIFKLFVKSYQSYTQVVDGMPFC